MNKKLTFLILILFMVICWKFLVNTFITKKKPVFDPSYIVLQEGNSLPLFGAIQSSSLGEHIFFNEETENIARSLVTNLTPSSSLGIPNHAFHHYVWTEICNNNLESLLYYPLFPHLPRVKSSTKTLVFNNLEANSGAYIFGKLLPTLDGIYKFQSSGEFGLAFQVWLSENEDPSKAVLIIDNKKTISDNVEFKDGSKYYICVVLKTGNKQGKFSLKLKLPGSHQFTLINNGDMESYQENENNFEMATSQNIPMLSSQIPIDEMYESKENKIMSKIFKMKFIPEEDTKDLFPTCKYSPSYLIRKKLRKYSGQWETHFSSVFPEDETDVDMIYKSSKKPHLIYGNNILNKKIAKSIASKVMNAITAKHKKYSLKNVLSVEENKDDIKGDRYFVELELLNNEINQSFRFSEYIYLPKGGQSLCYPENFSWNKTAEVNLIITSAGQGRWLIHFINTVARMYKETKDDNFAVTIVDFDTNENGVMNALKKSGLKKYTLIKRKGKFHKTLALNDAAASITNKDAIVTQVDLHLVIPSNFIDNVRKHTVKGRMSYSPLLNRLQCGSTPQKPTGFWEDEGYGIFGIYKSDWDFVGGMNAKGFHDAWGGEDWELLDSVLNNGYEVERLKVKNFHHVFHSKKNMWSSYV